MERGKDPKLPLSHTGSSQHNEREALLERRIRALEDQVHLMAQTHGARRRRRPPRPTPPARTAGSIPVALRGLANGCYPRPLAKFLESGVHGRRALTPPFGTRRRCAQAIEGNAVEAERGGAISDVILSPLVPLEDAVLAGFGDDARRRPESGQPGAPSRQQAADSAGASTAGSKQVRPSSASAVRAPRYDSTAVWDAQTGRKVRLPRRRRALAACERLPRSFSSSASLPPVWRAADYQPGAAAMGSVGRAVQPLRPASASGLRLVSRAITPAAADAATRRLDDFRHMPLAATGPTALAAPAPATAKVPATGLEAAATAAEMVEMVVSTTVATTVATAGGDTEAMPVTLFGDATAALDAAWQALSGGLSGSSDSDSGGGGRRSGGNGGFGGENDDEFAWMGLECSDGTLAAAADSAAANGASPAPHDASCLDVASKPANETDGGRLETTSPSMRKADATATNAAAAEAARGSAATLPLSAPTLGTETFQTLVKEAAHIAVSRSAEVNQRPRSTYPAGAAATEAHPPATDVQFSLLAWSSPKTGEAGQGISNQLGVAIRQEPASTGGNGAPTTPPPLDFGIDGRSSSEGQGEAAGGVSDGPSAGDGGGTSEEDLLPPHDDDVSKAARAVRRRLMHAARQLAEPAIDGGGGGGGGGGAATPSDGIDAGGCAEAGVAALFSRLDADDDGILSHEEFASMLRQAGHTSSGSGDNGGGGDGLLACFDTAGHCHVTLKQFRAFLLRPPRARAGATELGSMWLRLREVSGPDPAEWAQRLLAEAVAPGRHRAAAPSAAATIPTETFCEMLRTKWVTRPPLSEADIGGLCGAFASGQTSEERSSTAGGGSGKDSGSDAAAAVEGVAWARFLSWLSPVHVARISRRVSRFLRACAGDDFAAGAADGGGGGTLHAVFEAADTTNSGTLNGAGLHKLVNALGLPLAVPEAQALLQRYDRHGDGRLRFDDLLALVAGSSSSAEICDRMYHTKAEIE